MTGLVNVLLPRIILSSAIAAGVAAPSVRKNGTKPISPDSVLNHQIRPALMKLGIN
jgi:hypothetical protein